MGRPTKSDRDPRRKVNMKKIAIVASGLLWATGVFADGISSDIVGYTTKDAPQGKFLILTAPFNNLYAGEKVINGLIGGVEGVDYDDDNLWMITATQVQVPDEKGYTTYFYLNDGWVSDGVYKPGWCDAGGNIVDGAITSMLGFWFKSVPSAAMVKCSGNAPTNSQASILSPAVFSLRGNAFPVPIKLNSELMTVEGITGVNYDDDNIWMTTAPQIQVPSEKGYTTYFYLNDGWVSDGVYKPGWCDAGGNIVEDVIEIGQGFWTKGVTGPFKLVFKNNLSGSELDDDK